MSDWKWKWDRTKTDYVPGKKTGGFRDLTGQTFGRLTPQYPVRGKGKLREHGRIRWVCLCSCGTTKTVASSALTTGHIRSCGCLARPIREKNLGGRTGFAEVTGTAFCKMKANARHRGLEVTVTAEYLWYLYIYQLRQCALTGVPITIGWTIAEETTASIDRIDSSKGYIEGNVQWVHKNINVMKMAWNNEEFLALCTSVVDWHKQLLQEEQECECQ